jgi:tRNA dimethylallyltransferase
LSDERPGPFLVLTGPTAVGKTELSLQVAERLGAEIVSADSRQVYRGLDVGTAKPGAAERVRVPHHFVDELPLGAPWSAGRFAEAANDRIGAMLERGTVPLVVGGSTLYLEALVHGLAEVPAGEPGVRALLTQQARAPGGPEALYAELRQVDPAGAATLDPTKTQRLVRALEVYRTTGQPWSSYFTAVTPPPYRYRVIVLTRPREVLYRRIEERVERMLEAGLVEENRRLLEAGFRLDTNPLRTIGYQEPIAYLEGRIGYDEMVRRLKRNSRRYAKRQLTWLRRRGEYGWFDVEGVSVGEVGGLMQ